MEGWTDHDFDAILLSSLTADLVQPPEVQPEGNLYQFDYLPMLDQPGRSRRDAGTTDMSSNSQTVAPSAAASTQPSFYRPMYKMPGRLGDPRMELSQDARVNPRLLAFLTEHEMARDRASRVLTTMSPTSTISELEASIAELEAEFLNLANSIPNELPTDDYDIDVEHRAEAIPTLDGENLQLRIFRPSLRGAGALPCVVYVHGGGSMTLSRTSNKVHTRWCTSLAASGLICLSVDYRNARCNTSGSTPFPMGLNDVCAAIHHIHARRNALNLRNIVLMGEGMGGNLCIAAALKAKRENWLPKIDGVYAVSPCISNAYHWSEDRKLRELPSLVECHSYQLNVDYLAYMAHVYTPRSSDAVNSLAWPYHAASRALQGLPPHFLAMDELDPLRSEGEAMARKLAEADVQCVAHVNVGMTHAAALVFRKAVPEVNREVVRSVNAFAKSL